MIELSTHIEYLLFSHDEVSVPQLGTFIVKAMHSKRIEEEGIFLPPYRTLSFHWDEQEAGEEFIKSLSRLHNLQKDEARIMCVEYVDELLQTLFEEGTAAVGSMGMGWMLSPSPSSATMSVSIEQSSKPDGKRR